MGVQEERLNFISYSKKKTQNTHTSLYKTEGKPSVPMILGLSGSSHDLLQEKQNELRFKIA